MDIYDAFVNNNIKNNVVKSRSSDVVKSRSSDVIDVENLSNVVKDGHYVDENGLVWYVSVDPPESVISLVDPMSEVSFSYETKSGIKDGSKRKKNLYRNFYLKLFSFTFFRYYRKRFHKEDIVTLDIKLKKDLTSPTSENSESALGEEGNFEISVVFEHIEDLRDSSCIFCNRSING
jgi:hypothetical protein